MTFRTRLALAAAVAVAVGVAVAAAISYAVVRHELRGQLDDALGERAAVIAANPYRVFDAKPRPRTAPNIKKPPPLGGAAGYPQFVYPDGFNARPPGADVELPINSGVKAVAGGTKSPFFMDGTVSDIHVRIAVVPVKNGGVALELARPLTEVDQALRRVGLLLVLIGLVGTGAAVALGLLVARAALAPVRRLTGATEHVAATRDLAQRIDARGNDELSRLAASFNTMLEALEESARARRQLIADASHELRTPLTSLRTNIEVLARDGVMPPAERELLMHDVVGQLSEMTDLVAELVEVARGDDPQAEPEDIRLDLLVEGAVERARRRLPPVEFETSLEPSVVHGVPERIERAVSNLLDNAAKWSPPGSVVDVLVSHGELVVRDRGPGIDDGDLPFVFDRFYRAANARPMPGSGLGLAIVRDVAESHGGTAVATRAPTGGAELRIRLPEVAAVAAVNGSG